MDGFEFGDPGSDPSGGGYNLGSWTNTGGLNVLPGEGVGERADTGLTVPIDTSAIDPITGAPVDTAPGTPGIGWGMPGNLGSFLTDFQQGKYGDLFKGLFGGKYGDASQIAAFGGLAALLNRMLQQKPDPVGYQYGVPRYTATRSQTPLAQQRPISYESIRPREGEAAATVMRPVPYRPGQGGITYFTPMQYAYAGYEPKKAEEFLTPVSAPAAAPPAALPDGNIPSEEQKKTIQKADTNADMQSFVDSKNIDYSLPVSNMGSISKTETPSGIAALQPESAAPIVPKSQPLKDPSRFNVWKSGSGMIRVIDPDLPPPGEDWSLVHESHPRNAPPPKPIYSVWKNKNTGGTFVTDPGRNPPGEGWELAQGMSGGGIANLPSSMANDVSMFAGGRYLRGPGDGVSDSIPAKFERSGQPARLADGEFVIDARTVSEIGNGSSEAGARKLYAMMDRVHRARKTAKRGKPSGADKYLPK